MKKDILKNPFGLFALNITIGQDDQNYEENVTVDETVILGLYENTWLLPGVTYNDTYKQHNGTNYVKLYGQFNSDVTSLCDESTALGYEGTTLIPVKINSKASTVLGGCFKSKGLISPSEAEELKNEAGRSLAQAWQNDIEAMISTEGTPFTYTAADLDANPRKIIVDAKTAYKTANESMPTTLIVSYEYEGILTNTFANGQLTTPSENDKVVVNGTLGRFLGFDVIASNITELFYMYNWQTLHIPVAKDAFSDTVSNPNYGNGGLSNSALQIIDETNSKSGTYQTWFHWNYGKMIVLARQFLVGTEEVTAPVA